MTNKTSNYWKEIEKEFEEGVIPIITREVTCGYVESEGESGFSRERQINKLKSFLRQTLISTINKIGLEESEDKAELPEEFDLSVFVAGRQAAEAEIDHQKRDLVNQLTR